MFESILSFIKDPANRDALTWAAGGVVAVVGGLWTVVKFFAKKDGGGVSPGQRAENGGVVVGGDVIGSNIATYARSGEKQRQ